MNIFKFISFNRFNHKKNIFVDGKNKIYICFLKTDIMLDKATEAAISTAALNATRSTAYYSYIGNISQSGTAIPTGIVLWNSLGGTITFARTSAGLYTLTGGSAFKNERTICLAPSGILPTHKVLLYFVDENTLNLETWVLDDTSHLYVATDGILDDFSVEIRVYPT